MITIEAVERYCQQYSRAESPLLKEVHAYTQAHVQGAHMLSGVLVGGILQLLVRLMQAKVILDLGTFTGYSALTLAEASPIDAKILTCDQSPASLEIARRFFAQSEYGTKIQTYSGKVQDCIISVDQPIDFVFLDADKMQLDAYVDQLYPKLRAGGVIVVDNVLWRGEVVHPQQKYAQAFHAFNKKVSEDTRFTNVLLPIRDGLNIMMKKFE